MTKTTLISCLLLALQASLELPASAPKPALGDFGIELANRDQRVKPGDDFDRYANGSWFDAYQLKDYESRYGSFTTLSDRAEIQVRAIIEEMAKADPPAGSDARKIVDFYRSYLDLETRNQAGIAPLQPLLDRVAAIDSRASLVEAFGTAGLDGTSSPLGGAVAIDRMDPDRYLLGIGVGGLGLPDKDYYLNADARFQAIRAAYVQHIERMLSFAAGKRPEATLAAGKRPEATLAAGKRPEATRAAGEGSETTPAGAEDGAARAAAVLALETRIAEKQWDRAERRDRDKTYNLMSFTELEKRFGDYDWSSHLRAAGIDLPEQVNVTTPSAVGPVVAIIADTPLATWRDYLTFHAIANHAELLSEEIDQASFEFRGKVLSGQQSQKEWWKRAVAAIAGSAGLGDAVGRLYVERHFKPEAKQSMDELVSNLRLALRQNIEKLTWMGEETKAEAYKKLANFRPKIGYPDQWRDYSAVDIKPGDLVTSSVELRRFHIHEQNSRLNRPTDKDEWFMVPHRVNAYYNASFNEIVFPAAILQPPFFDVNADPAVNYGAIGGVIGHEMGHGFDDQGSKSDFAGIQRNWWSEDDRKRFEERTRALGAQYDSYCPLKGHCVNGKLAMGENIGDLGGLSMAYTAYKLSLKGKPAPVIDGLTGDQRFFLAWAQVWKSKYRDEAMINQVKVGPHSPPRYRINGTLRNLAEWYQAFDVKPGDALYLKPEERVRIW